MDDITLHKKLKHHEYNFCYYLQNEANPTKGWLLLKGASQPPVLRLPLLRHHYSPDYTANLLKELIWQQTTLPE